MISKEEKQLWQELISACRERMYSDDSILNVYFLCGCDQMHEAGYSSEEALKIAIELVKTKDKKEVYSELLKLTGYEED